MLKNAMLDLMQEKPVEKITIKETCERSELNRWTFYVHYNEPNVLLKSIEDEIIEDVEEILDEVTDDIIE